MTRSRSLGIRNRDRATPLTPINYDTEPIPRDIFGPLNTNDPSLKGLMTAIMVSHNKTSISLNKIDNRFIEFEKSLEFINSKVMENVQSIDSLRTENTELKSICNSLPSELTLLKQEVKQLKSKQDATERRSREWGIRVYGVPEVPREDTRAGFRFQVFIFNKYIGTIYIYGSINTKHEKQIKEILNKKEQKQ